MAIAPQTSRLFSQHGFGEDPCFRVCVYAGAADAGALALDLSVMIDPASGLYHWIHTYFVQKLHTLGSLVWCAVSVPSAGLHSMAAISLLGLV